MDASSLDPIAATNVWLATVAPADRARADAYFAGGCWLLLWDFLFLAAFNICLLATGLSRGMRDVSERAVRARPLQTCLYASQYVLVAAAAFLPLAAYEGFVREKCYGLSNQTFTAWLGDYGKTLLVALVFGGLAATLLYGVVRRFERSWAAWGAALTILLAVLGNTIAPVYVFPLFNDYTRLAEPVVREELLGLARAQGIPARDVYVFDASRQTKRVSANVSGLGATMRISLNDNLLNRCSLAEIEAVMGHEMGHYVLHHMLKSTLFFSVLIALGFAIGRPVFERVLARKGEAWGIRGAGDTAGLPLAVLLAATYVFLLTPVLNGWIRMEEAEADLFGVNASAQPDGEAIVDLKLGEYRKLDPTPLEELLFFDHPGGRSRILTAMRWKAEHLAVSEANARRAAELDRRRGWSEESARAWAAAHAPR